MDEHNIQQKFAVLIDGDNAQASLLPEILTEVSKAGLITIKRIYGDWTTATMNQWKDTLHQNAIQPVQQFRNTIGKNATDSTMIIDAMDLLHTNDLQGFCIVSSDSDYTRLATRIRENGLFVIGVGEKKTPEAFVNACNQFIYSENLSKVKVPRKKRGAKRAGEQDNPDPLPLLIQGFEMAAKEDEWAFLSTIGNSLRQLDPAFDPRTYGHEKLQSLLKRYPDVFILTQDRSKKPPVVNVSLNPKYSGN